MGTLPKEGLGQALAEPERGLEASEPLEERFDLGNRGLREHTARGVLINSAFQVGFAALGLVQRVVLAVFLTAEEYGIWGILLTTFITLSWLKQIGISDKYVQQDDRDQEAAFQKAFTLELAYSIGFWALLVASLPLFAAAYDQPDIIAPGLVLSIAVLISILHTPIWIAYRRMRFVRQRILEGLNPVVSTIVMIALASAGLGYWSVVWGTLAGGAVTAVAAVATSPYSLRWRYETGTLRDYFDFSWPLLASGGMGIIVVQGTMLVGSHTVGLAGVGAIALSASFLIFADRVDGIIMRSIYPAICAVKDRTELLFEVFIKSNRLALMWGLPFGLGMCLFAPDMVEFGFGSEWDDAVGLLQALGVVVGLRQIAFNWTGFMAATANTKPLAVNAGVLAVTFLAVTAPLMIAFGLDGYVVGVYVALAVELAVRAHFLRRLFPGFKMLRHVFRVLIPSLPGVVAVVLVRELGPEGRTISEAAVELSLYLLVTAAMTLLFERKLLGEIFGYIRGAARSAEPLPAA